MSNRPIGSKIAFYISILLYVIALTQPCFDTDRTEGEFGEGFALLISGFFGFFSSITALTWLANPALFISWLQHKKFNQSLNFSLTAFLISICFLLCEKIMVNEAGGIAYINGYRIGYWLWLLSIIAMLTSNLLLFFAGKIGKPLKEL